MRGRRVRLLTVSGPGGRRDVAVAADASLVHLLPVLVELVGGGAADPNSPRWALYGPGGQVLARTRSLAALNILDGQELVLATTSQDPDGSHREFTS